jgi:pyrimidine deaminase RibD-like protein
MLARIRALFDHWHQVKCAGALTDRDLHDLGMTRAQILALATMPDDVPDRLARMAALLGIPEAELQANRAEYLELVETCAGCGSRAPCAQLLAKAEMAQAEDAGFCPNAAAFRDHARRPD